MLEDFLDEELCIMDKISQPDGFGGIIYLWQEGAAFAGKSLRKRGDTLLVAQQQGARETYSITTKAQVQLERGTHVRRLKDGATMRIITDPQDGTPPGTSDMKFVYVLAERVSLP